MISGGAAVIAAAAIGYWLGQQRPPAQAAGGATPSANKAPAAASAPDSAVAVEAVKVATISLPQSITAVGSLRSDESVTVRPEIAGRVSAIEFREGERVAKGAVLVRLDPAINEAEVRQAQANWSLAKSKFDRAVDLAKSNFISSQAKDEAENNLRVAEASLSLSQARLAKMTIVAPFSGMIGLRSVSIGDYVKEGADIVNLENVDPLKVDFRVPEVFMRQVRVGQTLSVALDALPGKSWAGNVYAINPLLDAAGRSVVIRAIVRNSDISLRPGMFARVRLITDTRSDAIVVPEQALVPQGGDQYVFRVVDGRAQRVKVDIGQRRDAKVEIVQGLGASDLVITAGQLKIRDGVAVKVAEARAPAATADAQPGKGEAPVPTMAAPAPKS